MTQQQNNILKNLISLKYMGFNYLEPLDITHLKSTKQKLPDRLQSLNDIVSHCNLCEFSKTRKNILFGEGNVDADIMFLGLSPSSLDDESGNILSGNSGQMLIKMAQNILKVQIKDIYVVNILKCLPTDITNISSQVQICKPYVKKQIDIINPKVIVVFGDICQSLIDSQDYNNIKLIATYHPLFLLKNPSLKREALEDLKKVKNIIESL